MSYLPGGRPERLYRPEPLDWVILRSRVSLPVAVTVASGMASWLGSKIRPDKLACWAINTEAGANIALKQKRRLRLPLFDMASLDRQPGYRAWRSSCHIGE